MIDIIITIVTVICFCVSFMSILPIVMFFGLFGFELYSAFVCWVSFIVSFLFGICF